MHFGAYKPNIIPNVYYDNNMTIISHLFGYVLMLSTITGNEPVCSTIGTRQLFLMTILHETRTGSEEYYFLLFVECLVVVFTENRLKQDNMRHLVLQMHTQHHIIRDDDCRNTHRHTAIKTKMANSHCIHSYKDCQ